MISEFNWWLLLLGLVVGGGLTWLVLAETRRREQDLEDEELPEEAAWLEARLTEEGRPVPFDTIERVVQLHREYLAVIPPSDTPEDDWVADEHPPEALEPAAAPDEPVAPPPRHPGREKAEDPSPESSWRPPVA